MENSRLMDADNMSDEQRNDYLQEMALDWACDFYGVGFEIVADD